MSFPKPRPRRLRRSSAVRRLVRETALAVDQLVFPLFVCPGKNVRRDIPSLPGQFHFSVDELTREAEEIAKLGIPAVILFGLPEKKDEVGSEAWHSDGVVQRALRALKKAVPDLVLIVDACFCEYTTHGHCGVVVNGDIDNDATLDNLGRASLSYARSGADFVAPSGMMDGYVGFLRESLDEEGFEQVGLFAYSAKYASGYYGPFREAVDSTPAFGDRTGYQMDPANVREALRECTLDVAEGADALIVKPALPNLDVVRAVRERFDLPVGAYNVSGEYAVLKAAGARGWLDERQAALESLTAIVRAGADVVVSYWTKELAEWL